MGINSFSITVGDFNTDGRLDLATANYFANTVSILLGQGDGTFQAAPDVAVGASPGVVAVGDFNADGRLDLAVVRGGPGGTVAILLGQGDGTFQAAPNVEAVFFRPGNVTVGDFNADGRLDLAVPHEPFFVAILLGQGDGTFQGAHDVTVGSIPVSVTAGDFNADGHLDLATANFSSNSVSIRLGRGDGTFQAAQDVGVGGGPFSVTVGDFNADGRLDLAVANAGSNTVSILLNTPASEVNDFVTFIPLPATFQTTRTSTGCPAGFVGTFSFRTQLTSQPTSPPLTSLVVVVTTLTNGNLLRNAKGGPGGEGARLPVPLQKGFC